MHTDSGKVSVVHSHDMARYDDILLADKTEGHNGLTHPLLSEVEQQRLAAWNSTWQDYPRTACVQQLVEHQAAATPHALALMAGGQQLSYQDLNRRANQLAHALRARGVGPNVLVGLCVERSFDLVIGLLGILKAGGAYVPLDPSYPTERLAFMLQDAHVSLVLTQQHLLADLPLQNVQVICLDSDKALLAREHSENLPPSVTADDLVYVIYTSGSTGQPKGSLVTHDGLLNLVFWHQRAFGVIAADRATQVASPAFDATGWEVWPYLTCGASISFPDEDTRLTPTLLRDWLVAQRITITFLPTPLAESVMALEWPSTTALRFLLTGADKLQRYPSSTLPFALINNYGLTEATVVNTSGRIVPTAHPAGPPSIGYPIANTQLYLLDEHMRQAPIGEPGELYIGGAGLAKGYLNRPDLTAERFIRDPFSSEPEARLYKTGDLARFLPDGQIEFIGRIDHQIKIRGYRIEPSEIIAALDEHPAVLLSTVIAREDTPGEKRLVAYIVCVQDSEVTARELQESLQARLPDYMVPSAFVHLDTLPLTPNGKVDRAALPAPDASNGLRDEASTAPSTPTQIRLAAIVISLLNVEQVGLDDNFFMLGGHSLLGTQIIARVSETFGVALTLRSLFESPTVRQLAAEVETLIVAKLAAMSDEDVLRLLEQGSNV